MWSCTSVSHLLHSLSPLLSKPSECKPRHNTGLVKSYIYIYMIYETLQICWHKVDDEPSHLSKTETLLSPRDVVCPADNSFREKQQQDQSAAPQELHSKKPTQLCLQSSAQSERTLTPIPWADFGRSDRSVWTSGH